MVDDDSSRLPKLLTLEELSAELGIPISTLGRLLRRGDLPAVRLGARGGPVRFLPSKVREWLEAGGAKGPPRRRRRVDVVDESVTPSPRGRKVANAVTDASRCRGES